MGCAPAIPQTVFDNIKVNLLMHSISSFDNIMAQNEQTLSHVERVRYNVSLSWGKIIYLSGAIVLKHPRFGSVLNGLLFLIARDDNVNINLIQENPLNIIYFKRGHPIISIKPEKSIEESNMRLIEDIINYSNQCRSIKEEIIRLKDICIKMEETYNSNFDFWQEEFMKNKTYSLQAMAEFHGKCSDNKRVIFRAKCLIKEIMIMINQVSEDLVFFESKYREKDYALFEKSTFKKIHEDSKSNNIYSDHLKLFWDFTKEKKLHNFNDWLIVNDKIKSNKCLSTGYTSRNTIIQQKESLKEIISSTEKKPSSIVVKPNDPKETNEDDKVYQEGTIKETIKTIKFDKVKFFKSNDKLPIKNWVISLKKSISIDNNSKNLYPTCFEFNSTNDILIIGSNEGLVYTYDILHGVQIKKYIKMCGYIRCLCYLNDNQSFLSGSKDGIFIRWFFDDSEPIDYCFNQSVFGISSIVYTNNCETVFVSVGPYIFLFDLLLFQKSNDYEIMLGSVISRMIYLDKYLITGHVNGEVNIINYETKSVLFTYQDQTMRIKDISLCKFNEIPAVIVCSKDKTLKIYSIKEKKLLKNLDISPESSSPERLAYCYDNKTVIVCYENGKFYTVNYLTGKKKYSYSKESKIKGCIYSGDSSTLIFGNKDGNLDVFSAK